MALFTCRALSRRWLGYFVPLFALPTTIDSILFKPVSPTDSMGEKWEIVTPGPPPPPSYEGRPGEGTIGARRCVSAVSWHSQWVQADYSDFFAGPPPANRPPSRRSLPAGGEPFLTEIKRGDAQLRVQTLTGEPSLVAPPCALFPETCLPWAGACRWACITVADPLNPPPIAALSSGSSA
jgi:hypothetical protein